VPPGTIIGHEVAGMVQEVGPDVHRFKVGDRLVVGPVIPCGECRFCRRGQQYLCENEESFAGTLPGGFAEYMLVTAKALNLGSVGLIPDSLSFLEATLVEPLASVVKTHEMLNISEGDMVAVLGAGPVGCMHTQLARLRGASWIIQTDVIPERVKNAERFGADVVADVSVEDPVERIMADTHGRGADVVICAVPSTKVAAQAIEIVSAGGQVSWFAGLPKEKPTVEVDGNIVHYKDITISGTIGFAPRHFHRALELIASKRIDPEKYITGTLPLDGVVKGIEMIKRGEALKLIILPQE